MRPSPCHFGEEQPGKQMNPAPINSAEIRHAVTRPAKVLPADFVPLHLEQRTHVSTAVMCCHLCRQEQTARQWASAETYPPGMAPKRVMGRLLWPVAGIRAALGGDTMTTSAVNFRKPTPPVGLDPERIAYAAFAIADNEFQAQLAGREMALEESVAIGKQFGFLETKFVLRVRGQMHEDHAAALTNFRSQREEG